MEKIDYDLLTEEFKTYFFEKYRDFTDAQIEEVNNSNHTIDISVYTSKTVQEPKNIAEKFLKEKNIKNHSITNTIRSFQFDLDFYLLMATFDERIRMNHELLDEIWLHNQAFLKKHS